MLQNPISTSSACETECKITAISKHCGWLKIFFSSFITDSSNVLAQSHISVLISPLEFISLKPESIPVFLRNEQCIKCFTNKMETNLQNSLAANEAVEKVHSNFLVLLRINYLIYESKRIYLFVFWMNVSITFSSLFMFWIRTSQLEAGFYCPLGFQAFLFAFATSGWNMISNLLLVLIIFCQSKLIGRFMRLFEICFIKDEICW